MNKRNNFSYHFVPRSSCLIEKAAEFCGISVDEFRSKSEKTENHRGGSKDPQIQTYLIYRGMENIVVSHRSDTHNDDELLHIYRTDREDHEYFWYEGTKHLFWVKDHITGHEWTMDLTESGWDGRAWPDVSSNVGYFDFTYEGAKEAGCEMYDLAKIFEYMFD